MQITQRLSKLRSMPVSEMRDRVAGALRRQAEKATYRLGAVKTWNDGQLDQVAGQIGRRATQIVPGAARATIEKLSREFPQFDQQLRGRTQQRLAAVDGRAWRLFEVPVDLTGPIDWHRDPRTGYRWPRKFYGSVPLYEIGSQIDIKYVWELNRQQYLIELSRGWLLLKDQRHAALARRIVLDWIENNPVYEGVNWASALEVAIRATSWLWTLAGLNTWPGLTEDDSKRITRSLADHAGYLENHLSRFTSPYNHLIGEATGLYLLGSVLEGHASAAAWKQRGRQVLAEFGPRQFYADGFSVEQSVGYHYFTLGMLVQAVVAARHSGSPMEDLEPVVSKAFTAGAAMRQPDGRWPTIGDDDSAYAIPVLPDDPRDFRSYNSLGAVLFGKGELKAVTDEPGEELYWLMGVAGLQNWRAMPAKDFPPSVVLPDSGYAVARSSDDEQADWLLLDAGPLADGLHADATPSVAHGHLDALQLLLFQSGRAVLADPGIPSYLAPRRWVDPFRDAAAHNTLEVEGAPLARCAGRLAWSHVRAAPRLEANLSSEVWLVRGQVDLGDGITAERNVLGLPGEGVWIADSIRTPTPRKLRWYWQTPGDVAPTPGPGSDSPREITLATGVMAIWTDAENLRISVESASADSPVAWHSPAYGSKQAGHRISFEAGPVSAALLVTFIGSKLKPACVELRGRRLSCGVTGDVELPSLPEDCRAEVLWCVEADGGLSTIAAGTSGSPPAPWKVLEGTGGWPALTARLIRSAAGKL